MPPWLSAHQWSGDLPGARLRQARLAKNLTIRDLAAATGLSVVSLGNLETDKCKASLPNLRTLAKVLGHPIVYLGCFERLPVKTLGQRITKARLYHGLTKEEMAQSIGVDQKTLRHWEQDKHQPLRRHSATLSKYIEILDK